MSNLKTPEEYEEYHREACRKSYWKHLERRRLSMRERYQRTKEKKAEYNKKFYADHKDDYATRYAAYYKEHREVLIEKASINVVARRAAKRRGCRFPLSEFDRFVFSEAKKLALLRDKISGIKWHVDHIEPLQGKDVCGLHNGFNIAVVPATYNLAKNNRRMPAHSWIGTL